MGDFCVLRMHQPSFRFISAGKLGLQLRELFGNAPVAASSTAPHLVYDKPLSIFVAVHGSWSSFHITLCSVWYCRPVTALWLDIISPSPLPPVAGLSCRLSIREVPLIPSNPGEGEIFRTCPHLPWGQPSLLYNGYRLFLGVKSGRGVTLTLHPLLVPWSGKSKTIHLLPLWVVRPVQSLSACTRVHFTLPYFYPWSQPFTQGQILRQKTICRLKYDTYLFER